MYLALGSLQIEQLRGLGVFLKLGGVTRPLFSKTSRCWCVDGKTKFVLCVSDNKYYRIELLNDTYEDRLVADELKSVLAKVSFYEQTQCPFKREFHVTLPESPKTPIIKRPWKPKHRAVSFADLASPTQGDSDGSTRAVSNDENEYNGDEELRLHGSDLEKNLEPDAEAWPSGGDLSQADNKPLPMASNDLPLSSSLSSLDQGFEKLQEETTESHFDSVKAPIQPKTLNETRSVTAPPQLSLNTVPPSGTGLYLSKSFRQDPETASLASSVDSFHSFHSFHSPIIPLPPSPPPSPPYTDPPSPSQYPHYDLGIDVPRSRQHKRGASELTVTASTFSLPSDSQTPKWPSFIDPSTPAHAIIPLLTNGADSQWFDAWPEPNTPSPPATVRSRVTRHRAYSPLPRPENIYSSHTRISGHHLTTAILQKMMSLLLGPPVQLVALMLNIAARVADGAYRGMYLNSTDGETNVPCTWVHSESEEEARDVWEDDDLGVSLGVVHPSRTREATDIGGSWEID